MSADQSALGGLDYAATSTPISFADDEVSKTIPIALSNDGLHESDETFTVQLTGGALGAARSATVTIRDAVLAGRIELTSAVYSAGESGGSVLVGVRHVGGLNGTVSASLGTQDGTALGGEDYFGVKRVIVLKRSHSRAQWRCAAALVPDRIRDRSCVRQVPRQVALSTRPRPKP